MLKSNLYLFPCYSLLTEQLMAIKAMLMFKLPNNSLGSLEQKSLFNYGSKYQTLINNLDDSFLLTEKIVDEIGCLYLPGSSIKGSLRSNLEQLTHSKETNTDTKIIFVTEAGDGKTYSGYMTYFTDCLKKLHINFDVIRCFNERYVLINHLDSVLLLYRERNINETWLSYIFNKHFKNRLCSNLEQLANSQETNEYAEIIKTISFTDSSKSYLTRNYIEKNTVISVIYAGGDDFCAVVHSPKIMENLKIQKNYINYIFTKELHIPFLSLKGMLRPFFQKALNLMEISTYTKKMINNANLMRNNDRFFSKENCFFLNLWSKSAFLNTGMIHNLTSLICNLFAKNSSFTKKEMIFNKGKTRDNNFLKNTFIHLIQPKDLDKNKIFGCIHIKFCLEKFWSKLVKLQYSYFSSAKIYVENLENNLKMKIKLFYELQSSLIKCIFIPCHASLIINI